MSCKEFIFYSFYFYLFIISAQFQYFDLLLYRNSEKWLISNCFNNLKLLMLKILQFFSIEIELKSFRTKKRVLELLDSLSIR